MGHLATDIRTLSKNEASLILALQWEGKRTVGIGEIRRRLGASDAYAWFIAHRLAKKGWLERIRPGIYQVIPADRGPEGVPDANPLIAHLLVDGPYFYSYGTACTLHGLTDQVFSEVYVATQTPRRPAMVRGKRYIFLPHPKSRFFGFEERMVLGQSVQLAEPERALIDALDKPRHAGGIGEVSLIVKRAATRVAWSKLVSYLRRWKQSAPVQRLGALLDIHSIAIPESERKELVSLVRPKSKVLLGPRNRWGTRGPLLVPWNVVRNVPEDVILENRRDRRKVR